MMAPNLQRDGKELIRPAELVIDLLRPRCLVPVAVVQVLNRLLFDKAANQIQIAVRRAT